MCLKTYYVARNTGLRAVHLKSIDSVDLVLASPNQCIISGVQRTANATETAIV